ncbi:TetR/AcrR family transcriptional regulator [Microlunatus speluncae]|uniref:TetR/AcrR family transcriptional regulator n=1 Tax=Microlunatus speluncae TaxID=2594267 RepID=UPI0012663D21|nr:TetR/AcrR family transcriptional regulator [Microlunatus speluncae]
MTAAAPGTRGATKRQAILDAAAELFAEDGYERASIDAIAGRAGVSKPTVYSHFGNKERLFRESLAESSRQLNEQSYAAAIALDVGANWEQSLRQVAVQLVECQRSPCAASLQRQLYAEINRDPEVFSIVRSRGADPMIEALAGRLAMLANAGHLKLDDPLRAAKQFLALIGAEMAELTVLGTGRGDDRSVTAAVRAGVETFLRAYRT